MAAGASSSSGAVREYATEALRHHAYRRLAMAQIGEFGSAYNETKETARALLARCSADAIEVPLAERPGTSVFVQRVRRRAAGSLTQRRLEEIALKPMTGEDAQRLRQIASAVQQEIEAEAAKQSARAANEERKRQRREAAEVRRVAREAAARAKAERDAARQAKKAADAALDRRVQQGVRQLERADASQ